VQLGVSGHLGITVARQVHQQAADLVDPGFILAVLAHMGAADREIIDMLRSAGRLGSERQFFLVAQYVDRGGFARVRAACKRDFGHPRAGQVAQMVDGSKETCLPELGHGLYRIYCWEGESRKAIVQ